MRFLKKQNIHLSQKAGTSTDNQASTSAISSTSGTFDSNEDSENDDDLLNVKRTDVFRVLEEEEEIEEEKEKEKKKKKKSDTVAVEKRSKLLNKAIRQDFRMNRKKVSLYRTIFGKR